MEVNYSPNALEDLNYWREKHDSKTLQRIRKIIENMQEDPFKGIGKPEPLKYNYAGFWSRRINNEHRIIYEIDHNTIIIHALREHY